MKELSPSVRFFCEDAGAKRSVAANVDAPEEDNESHSGIIEKKDCATPLRSRRAFVTLIGRVTRNEKLRRPQVAAGDSLSGLPTIRSE